MAKPLEAINQVRYARPVAKAVFQSPMLHHITHVLRLTQLLALLLVIGMGVVLYGVLAEFEKAAWWVAHTQQVIDEIEAVRLESLRSGIWLRNFMVVPNAESLQRVRSSPGRDFPKSSSSIYGLQHLRAHSSS